MKLQELSLRQGLYSEWVRLVKNGHTIVDIDPDNHFELDERLELAFAYNQLPSIIELLGELLPIIEDHEESRVLREKLEVIVDEINYAPEIKNKEEKTIPITLWQIKATCGWSKYCDITGGNHYALKEWSVSDSEVYNVKESHAKQLGIIN